jgi:hypothetical protein
LAGRVAEGARRLYAEHLSWDRITDRFLAEGEPVLDRRDVVEDNMRHP